MTSIFEIFVQMHFSAAHFLKGYGGDCAAVHGHNWTVTVFVECRELDEIGMGIDFRELKKQVQDVVGELDHICLNDHEGFKEINPTSENAARYIYRELAGRINKRKLTVSKVKVCETGSTGVIYREEPAGAQSE